MFELTRYSPVKLGAPTARTTKWDGFDVVLEYKDEGPGPWLVDLSHRPKWDVQDDQLDLIQPWGRTIPQVPNQSVLADGLLINRMNRTQASIWQIAGDEPLTTDDPHYTSTTDGLTLLALAGGSTPALLERITSLDLADPKKTPPFLVQGPMLHIPGQVVVVKREPAPLVLFAFSRGYGQCMFESLLHDGKNLGLKPAGEAVLANILSA
jgi:hypothetical protein